MSLSYARVIIGGVARELQTEETYSLNCCAQSRGRLVYSL